MAGWDLGPHQGHSHSHIPVPTVLGRRMWWPVFTSSPPPPAFLFPSQVATKQFVGMGKQAGHVYALGGSIWRCDRQLETAEISQLLAATRPACGLTLRGVQSPVGQPERQLISGSGCGGWMPPEFRMCAPQLRDVGPHSLLLHDGQVFSQRVESDPAVHALGGACHEGAFFHMQEWKKRWARDGAANVDPQARFDAFRISESGIHALPGMLRGV